jgi:hypothetical protein
MRDLLSHASAGCGGFKAQRHFGYFCPWELCEPSVEMHWRGWWSKEGYVQRLPPAASSEWSMERGLGARGEFSSGQVEARPGRASARRGL